MTMRTRSLGLVLALGCLEVLGCAAKSDDAEAGSAASNDAASEALTIEQRTDASVSGRFRKGSASVTFTFSKDAEGKHVRVSTLAGAPMVESVIRGASVHTTRLLGGRLVIEAAGKEPPTYTGDRAAEAALHDMPEATCLDGLERALAAANVDPSLLPLGAAPQPDGAAPREGAGSHPDAFYGAPYAVFAPCNTWNPPHGTQALCGSVFLGWTPLYEYNCSPYYALVVFDGLQEVIEPARSGFCSVKDHSGWWWGQNIVFVNTSNSWIYYGH